MQEEELPIPNTLWRNLKKGTVYKVWMLAREIVLPDLTPYVIYQEQTLSLPPVSLDIFTVQDSENERLGNVFNTPLDLSEWMLHWEKGLTGTPLAWARPLSLWYSKFEEIIS